MYLFISLIILLSVYSFNQYNFIQFIKIYYLNNLFYGLVYGIFFLIYKFDLFIIDFFLFSDFISFNNSNYLNNFFNVDWINLLNNWNVEFESFLNQSLFDISTGILSNFNSYLNFPLFIWFGVLFFISTIVSLLTLNYLGLYGVFMLNFIILIFLWVSLFPYLTFIFNENGYFFISLGKWMYLNSNYKVSFDFFIDNVSLSFSFLTLTIAVFVYPYTFSYFRYEPLVDRLILFLNGFIISMVFLVSSGNFIMLFLGWEMIGLTSFFLINFWSTRVGTLKAAFKAYSFNKVSDVFLFIAILLIFNLSFNLDIPTFLNQIHLYENYTILVLNFTFNYTELISIFLLGSAFIKSAQFGAHIWLPDSMEAPVPASALIHSATLVSAGIYLLLRFTNLFELSYLCYTLIALIGSLTAFYGGFASMFQSDVKRILAYSTISHCGFLMVMYTTGVIEYVILYLYIHGFFKAAVFLCVGNVIRFTRNIQDFKRMGGFWKYLPFDCLASFICLINLSGLPLTFGFYIKHILFVGLKTNSLIYWISFTLVTMAAFTGLFYSYRLFYFVFFDIKKSRKTIYIQSSRAILNSKFYLNSSYAGMVCIISLILVAYSISIYLFSTYFNVYSNTSDFTKTFENISFFFLKYGSYQFLLNSSILNWIVIIFITAIIFTPWRTNFVHYNSLYHFSLVTIFFYIFFQLL